MGGAIFPRGAKFSGGGGHISRGAKFSGGGGGANFL